MDEEAMLNGGAMGTSEHPHLAEENAEAGPSSLPMSKNAQKKAAKLARLAAEKPIKRAQERQKRRDRAAQLREGYANGTLTPEELAIVEGRKAKESLRRSTKKRFNAKGEVEADSDGDEDETGSPRRKKGKGPWEGAILIDLGFDELMLDGEIKSMASQVSYCYAANRQARIPVRNVIHTSASPAASPRLWPPLAKAPCERWIGCQWFGGSLEEYIKSFNAPASAGDATNGQRGVSSKTHSLVYLSADAEDELETLREDEVYIIGGIVDRNRYKNKAERLEIRTARLPIGAYIANLPTRKVLTVNQVFQILTEYIDKQDWKEAFETVIPSRKFVEKKRRRRGGEKDTDAVGGAPTRDQPSDAEEDDQDAEVDEAHIEESLNNKSVNKLLDSSI